MSARSSTTGLSAEACGAPPRRTAVTDVVVSPRVISYGSPSRALRTFSWVRGRCQADLRLLVQLVAQPGDLAVQFLGIGGDRHMFPLPERLVSA